MLSVFEQVLSLSRHWLESTLVNAGLLKGGFDPNLVRLFYQFDGVSAYLAACVDASVWPV